MQQKRKKIQQKGMLFLCLGRVRKRKLYNVGQKKNSLVGGLEIATNTVTNTANFLCCASKKIHVSSKIATSLVCNHTLSSDLLIKICNELIPLRLNLSSGPNALVTFEPRRVVKTTGLLLLDVK